MNRAKASATTDASSTSNTMPALVLAIAQEDMQMTSRLIIGVAAGVLGLMIAATVGAAELNGSWKRTYEALCLKRSRLSFRVEIRGRAVPYRGRTVRVTPFIH
jgi:hypothetical protein